MMGVDIEPRWLKSVHTQGLDQLGLQIISISIYGELLPGLTNVTDRVRYYSFFPWLLHRYATDIKSNSVSRWQEHLRRAEFLLALIGKEHHVADVEGGEALIGSDTADIALKDLRSAPSKVFQLSKWTDLANVGKPGSYFKNKNGGFGQYYKGVLAELEIIAQSDDTFGLQLHPVHGVALAGICDAQSGRAEFWRAVAEDTVSLDLIRRPMSSLCPCSLTNFEDERSYLTGVMFGQDGWRMPNGRSRASSLLLLLSMCQKGDDFEDPVSEFRRIAYYGHSSLGVPYVPPIGLESDLHKWGIYQTGEFVHYALEQAFKATLELLQNASINDSGVDRFLPMLIEEALATSSKKLGLSDDDREWRDRKLGDLLLEVKQSQKSLADFANDPWSEVNLQPDVQTQGPNVAIARALATLISVVARNRVPDDPFSTYGSLGPNFHRRHQVNLATLRDYLTGHQEATAATVLHGLLSDRVIGQHILVAMRKLRFQNQSTFKVALEEGRYIWIEDFKPTYTNPRLRQAFRFLRDLGLCEGKSGGWRITELGRRALEGSDVV